MAYGSVALWITRQYREREFRGRDCLTYDAPWGIDHDFVVKDDRYLAVHFVVIKVCGKIYGSLLLQKGCEFNGWHPELLFSSKLASDHKSIEHVLTITCSLSNVKKCQLFVSGFPVSFLDFFGSHRSLRGMCIHADQLV